MILALSRKPLDRCCPDIAVNPARHAYIRTLIPPVSPMRPPRPTASGDAGQTGHT